MVNKSDRFIRDQQKEKKKYVLIAGLTLLGAALIQLALASSYLVAFHAPKPHQLPIAIIGESAKTKPVVEALTREGGDSFDVQSIEKRDDAISRLKTQKIYAAYVPSFPTGEVIIASANSKSTSQSVASSLEQFDKAYQEQARKQLAANPQTSTEAQAPISAAKLTDIAALASGDGGAAIFYTAFSAVFGGYLAAVALNLVRGKREFTKYNALLRTAGFAIAAVVTGFIVALIATHGVAAIPGSHIWAVAGILALIYFGVAMFSSALISLLGIAGTAIVILLFVILGNPASGGVVPVALTDNGPWHWLAAFLPTGAGVGAIRQTVYFEGVDSMRYLLVPILYAVFGFIALFASGAHKSSVSVYEEEIAEEVAEEKTEKKL